MEVRSNLLNSHYTIVIEYRHKDQHPHFNPFPNNIFPLNPHRVNILDPQMRYTICFSSLIMCVFSNFTTIVVMIQVLVLLLITGSLDGLQ